MLSWIQALAGATQIKAYILLETVLKSRTKKPLQNRQKADLLKEIEKIISACKAFAISHFPSFGVI